MKKIIQIRTLIITIVFRTNNDTRYFIYFSWAGGTFSPKCPRYIAQTSMDFWWFENVVQIKMSNASKNALNATSSMKALREFCDFYTTLHYIIYVTRVTSIVIVISLPKTTIADYRSECFFIIECNFRFLHTRIV